MDNRSAQVVPVEKTKKPWLVQLMYLFLDRVVINANTRMLYAFVPVFMAGMLLTEGEYFNALAVAGIFGFLTPIVIPFAETKGRRFAMGIALTLFAAGNFLCALVPNFWAISAGLGIGALAMSLFSSASQAYVGDETPFEKRGRFVAVLELGWSASFFIMMPILSVAMSRAAAGNNLWKTPFFLLGGLSLIALLLLRVIIPNTPPPKHIKESGDSGLKLIVLTLKEPYVVVALLYGIFVQLSAEYMNVTYALWLDDMWGIQIATLGIIAFVFGITEMLGEGSVIQFSDRFGKQRMCRLGNALGAVAALAAPFVVGLGSWPAIFIIALFYFSFEIGMVTGFSVMTQVVPKYRAAFMGIYAAMNQLGRIIADYTAAPIMSRFGSNGYAAVSVTAGLAFAVCFVLMLFVKVQNEDV